MTRIKLKTSIIIASVALIYCMISILVSRTFVNNLLRDYYENRAKEIADTMAVFLDMDDVKAVSETVLDIYNTTPNHVDSSGYGTKEYEAYIAHYQDVPEMEEYRRLCESMRKLQSKNDVDCLYLSYMDMENNCALYLLDIDETDACAPGSIDCYYDLHEAEFFDYNTGFDPYITDTEEYGWLATAGTALVDDAGNVYGYAMVDISMTEIFRRQNQFIFIMAFVIFLVTIAVTVICCFIINYMVANPIKRISDAAMQYCASENLGNSEVFAALDIRTGDEIQELSDSLKEMEQTANGYARNLKLVRDELDVVRQQADEQGSIIMQDPLTGIRNRAAFDIESGKLDILLPNAEEFGIAVIDLNQLSRINDCFGREKGDAAIVKLCRVICLLFTHSPVFRIGGDEFAVILKNHDLERAEELIRSFYAYLAQMAEDEETYPWEKFTATIGYAQYDKERDSDVEHVYMRAMESMNQLKSDNDNMVV